MIAKLNLASHPFRNRTLPWAVTVVVAGASLVALILVISEGAKTRRQADAVESDVRALRDERAALQRQAEEVRESLTPEQTRTLDAANVLVERKRFSWSRLLADLEASLPSGVRVSRIRVGAVSRAAGQTRADLELAVVGRTPTDVTRMISEMNAGGTFSVIPLSESPRTGRGETGFEWTLRVNYAPRAVVPARTQESAGANNVAASETSIASANGAASSGAGNSNTEARELR